MRRRIPLLVVAVVALVSCLDTNAPRFGAANGISAVASHSVGDAMTTVSRDTFFRKTGKPVVETRTISTTGCVAPFVLTIQNGDANGGHRVSSGTVSVNGTQILGPSSFSQQFAGTTVNVAAGATVVVSVQLQSAPGSYLVITLDCGVPPTPAQLSISPDKALFGTVDVGTTATATFTVTNTGGSASGVPTVTIGGHPDFTITANTCTVALPSGGTCAIETSFMPTSVGPRIAHLDVEATPGGAVGAPLDGTGRQFFHIAVTKAGNGSGSITSAPSSTDIDCGTTCTATLVNGTVVTLTATPDANSTFTGWSGGGCTGTGICSVTMSAETSVTATFSLKTYQLSVAFAGTGTGTVTSAPASIVCAPDCEAFFDVGTVVTLTAASSSESQFTGWSGAGCVGTGTCTVTMDAAKTVTATFTIKQFRLTVQPAGTGLGTVTSMFPVDGITCGTDCSEDYPAGTVVTLMPTPVPGSFFVGWSGGGCTGTGLCTVTMNSATIVTATFDRLVLPLVVARFGDGSGTVTSAPAGINCGVVCTASYAGGTVVTLTPTPAPGSTFTGWSGSGCVGTGICMVTVNSPLTVIAQFSLIFPLAIAKAGTGFGTVTSVPGGINCGATCVANYVSGTSVTLTATADPGSGFTGWTGAGISCGGIAPCSVPMTAARVVTANFQSVTFTLAVLTGGSGSVTSSPAGISCPSNCARNYAPGTVVTLTATPGAGMVFGAWGGDCAGEGSHLTCNVIMTSARSVTATFVPAEDDLFAGTGDAAAVSPQLRQNLRR